MKDLKYKSVIEGMTLREKAELLSGRDIWRTRGLPRLGIPPMFLADGPHGVRKQNKKADHLGRNPSEPATCFPSESTMANSWDERLCQRVGELLGEEAAAQGVNVLLGPGVNLKRDPRCGRNFEYLSEDPYLSGKLGAAYVRGIQSRGVAACPKHFCANNRETGRMCDDSVIDERSLREMYLSVYEILAREGGAKALMSAYNRVNGIYASENESLLRNALRGDIGFSGVVITDWGASNDRVLGVKAGNDLEMPGPARDSTQRIVAAVESGRLSMPELDECVDRIIDLALSTKRTIPASPVDMDAQHEASRSAAEGSIVLLKNDDHLLPLRRGQKVAVIGAFAHQSRFQGDGSSAVNPTKVESALACLAREGVTVIGYEAGFSRLGVKSSVSLRRAKALARRADVVLLYLGLEGTDESEGVDRFHLRLPHNQIAALEAIAEANPNVAVVLSCGSPVEMPWLPKARALLHGYLGGQAGAWAAIRVLTGEVNPSGKLAETYPVKCADGPTARSFFYKTAEYREALYVGYRYYDSAAVRPLFPFGFGLSYTSFDYSGLEVGADGVSFTLTNSGERDGAEAAQLYVALPGAKVFRPVKELKGFTKVFLRAREAERVFIPFDDKTFRYYNVHTHAWEIEGGEYRVMVGASSADIRLTGRLSLKGTGASLPYEPQSLPTYYSGRVGVVPKHEFERLLGRPLPPRDARRRNEIGPNDAIMNCRRARSFLARAVYWALTALIWVSRKTGRKAFANDVTAWAYQMPFRGLARLLSGRIDEPMLEAILIFVNGKHALGLARLYRAVREKEKNRLLELLGWDTSPSGKSRLGEQG